MKKILLMLVCLLLVGCGSNKVEWPNKNIVEYNKGTLVSVESIDNKSTIKVNDTTKEDMEAYVEALATITFNVIEEQDNYFKLYDGKNYVELTYEDSDIYDVTIVIY